MRILPSGTRALLIELDDLDAVLGLYAALEEERPDGVVDVVPAARTVLVVADPAVVALPALAQVLQRLPPRPGARRGGELVEVPVAYDGHDLTETAELLGWSADELVRRHTAAEWTVAFCGFAPGFGYLTAPTWDCDVPRRASPRTRVPPGAVALAGRFAGVYPRASPGGWQLVGHTDLAVLDLEREPAALLRPGVRVRFVEVGRR
jgi:KipI family sensor histidine kinase inhibitor